jgi:hypothetical protein
LLLGGLAFFGPPIWALYHPREDPVRTALVGSLILALAALTLTIDRVFLYSSHWTRNTNAMIAASQLLTDFGSRWASVKLARGDKSVPPSPELTAQALALIQAHIVTANKILETESAEWATQVAAANQKLDDVISSPSGAFKDLQTITKEYAEARLQQTRLEDLNLDRGIVKFVVDNQAGLSGQVTITWTGPSSGKDVTTGRGAAMQLKPGHYKFTATAKSKQEADVHDEEVVIVKAGEIQTITFALS